MKDYGGGLMEHEWRGVVVGGRVRCGGGEEGGDDGSGVWADGGVNAVG